MKNKCLRFGFLIAVLLGGGLTGALALVAWPLAGIDSGEAADSPALIEAGLLEFQALGCNACHSVNGKAGLGPSLLNLPGSSRTMQDGETLLADEAYIRESIAMPAAKKVSGFRVAMPYYESLTPEQLEALVAYLKSLHEEGQAR